MNFQRVHRLNHEPSEISEYFDRYKMPYNLNETEVSLFKDIMSFEEGLKRKRPAATTEDTTKNSKSIKKESQS